MRWCHRHWPQRTARPKKARLSPEALQRLHARAERFVKESAILWELLDDVQLAQGRLYLWRQPEDLMARITPLALE